MKSTTTYTNDYIKKTKDSKKKTEKRGIKNVNNVKN
jgi:hypothetical protein